MSSPSSMIVVRRVGVPSSSMPSLPHSPVARAVVVGGHERLGQLLAELPGVDAGALLHGVGLEAVARPPRAAARRRSRCPPPPAAGPVGASTASSSVSALRAACSATSSGSASSSSKPAWPPRVSVPVSTRSSRRATTCTPRRTRVRSSAAASAVGVEDLHPRGAPPRSRRAPGRPRRRPRGRARRRRAAGRPCARRRTSSGAHAPPGAPAARSAAASAAGSPAAAPRSGLRHRLRHAQQVLLGQAVHVAEVGGLALHHAHAGARARGRSGGAPRGRRRARARSRCRSSAYSSARSPPCASARAEHPLGQLGRDQAHGLRTPSDERGTMLARPPSSARLVRRAPSGWSRRA